MVAKAADVLLNERQLPLEGLVVGLRLLLKLCAMHGGGVLPAEARLKQWSVLYRKGHAVGKRRFMRRIRTCCCDNTRFSSKFSNEITRNSD